MKYNITLKTYIFTISLIFFSVFSFGQNVKSTYDFAQEQMRQENYQEALHNFHRVAYFDKHQYRYECAIGIAQCYMKLQESSKALSYFDIAIGVTSNDSLKTEILFDKVECLLLAGKPKMAKIELFNISHPKDHYFSNKYNFYDGIICFRMEKI